MFFNLDQDLVLVLLLPIKEPILAFTSTIILLWVEYDPKVANWKAFGSLFISFRIHDLSFAFQRIYIWINPMPSWLVLINELNSWRMVHLILLAWQSLLFYMWSGSGQALHSKLRLPSGFRLFHSTGNEACKIKHY